MRQSYEPTRIWRICNTLPGSLDFSPPISRELTIQSIGRNAPTEGLATEIPIQSGEPVGGGQEDIGAEEKQNQEEEVDRVDISTEYEMGQDQRSSTVTPPPVHPCILELHSITSNIKHLKTLLAKSLITSFDLQVI